MREFGRSHLHSRFWGGQEYLVRLEKWAGKGVQGVTGLSQKLLVCTGVGSLVCSHLEPKTYLGHPLFFLLVLVLSLPRRTVSSREKFCRQSRWRSENDLSLFRFGTFGPRNLRPRRKIYTKRTSRKFLERTTAPPMVVPLHWECHCGFSSLGKTFSYSNASWFVSQRKYDGGGKGKGGWGQQCC